MAAATKTARQTYQDLLKESDAIEAKAKAEKRDLTEDESARMAAIADEVAEAKATMQSEEAQARADAKARGDKAREDLAAERLAAQQPLPRQVTRTNTPAVAREAWLDDPKRGYSSVKALLLDLRASRITGRLSPQVKSLQPRRDYFAADIDEMQAAAGSDEHSTFDLSSLGVMVPDALLPGVKMLDAPEDPFPGTLRIPLSVPQLEILARVDKTRTSSVSGGFQVYRRAESGTVAASRAKVEKVTLRADPVMGVTYETAELMADAPEAAMAFIDRGFREEFLNKRIKEILEGTGAGENLGWANAPCSITVSKETGQAADTIVYENLLNMLARCYKPRRWIANQTCLPTLGKLNGGTNGLIWQPSAREGAPSILMGLPLVFTEYCKAVGDLGDIAVVNDAEYIEVIRQDVQTEASIHVRFLENENTYRFTQRRGGTPWWRGVLTPVNGATLAPFVRLEAR